MIVVFDTNIWLSQLGMRSPTASAVRFFLKHHDYRIALPEVVKLEVENNLKPQLMKSIEAIRDSHAQLLTAFGKLREVALPSEENVDEVVRSLFDNTGVTVIQVPFSMDSARSSFEKTIKKLPPSHATQQFKDGVLWADCLKLLETDDVTLVTADKAFFLDQKYEKGLARNLLDEASRYDNKIRVVESLTTLLETLPTAIILDESALIGVIIGKAGPSVRTFVDEGGFELIAEGKVLIQFFATEQPDRLFFNCSMVLSCPDISGLDRPDAKLEAEADGLYIPATGQFDNVGMKALSFTFQGQDGEEVKRRSVYARTTGVYLGHREITNIVRYRLPDYRNG